MPNAAHVRQPFGAVAIVGAMLVAYLCSGAAQGEDKPSAAATSTMTTRPAASAPASRPTSSSQPALDGPQWWKGVCDTPGTPLEFVVVFRAGDDGQLRATIDIPAQGAKALPLSAIELSATRIHFSIAGAGAEFELTRAEQGDHAKGELRQHGATIPVRMERTTEDGAAAVGPVRPQNPKPPFPYTAREVTYENTEDRVKLAGTLTIPPGPGPHPAVVLITGSGAQDRDETIFGHKPFLVWADHLSRHGIAVLRSDDRGVGGSTGDIANATTEAFARDALAAVAFLKQQPEIDARRIGLIGHSEGGIVAPLAAAQATDIVAIVLLAGSGVPGDELLGLQMRALLRAAGRTSEQIDQQVEAQQAMLRVVRDGGSDEELQAGLRELVRVQLTQASGSNAPSEDALSATVAQALPGVRSLWMRSFVRCDPRAALRKVKCPVLALGGALDLQVPPQENLPQIEAALRAGGNEHATARELPGLNHLLQEAKTGSVGEYAAITQTIAPAALDTVTDWLREQFRLQD
jgi:pimeloyl-ACP methyl ester carboxylesterase